MKIIILLITLSLSLSSFASNGGLREVLDEHRFFVEVEWDQKDMAALSRHESELSGKLALVSSSELEEYLRQNVSAEELSVLKIRLRNSQDPLQVMRDLSFQKTGANWNGAAKALIYVSGAAFIVFVAYTWFIHNQLECDGFYDCHGGE